MSIGEIRLGLLNAEYILTPLDRKFKIETTEIGRSERTADGTLVTDIIATKKRFILTYATIDQSDLLYFQQLYDLKTKLSLLIYTSDTNYTGYWVSMQPFNQSRLLSICGGVWENVTIILDEI